MAGTYLFESHLALMTLNDRQAQLVMVWLYNFATLQLDKEDVDSLGAIH